MKKLSRDGAEAQELASGNVEVPVATDEKQTGRIIKKQKSKKSANLNPTVRRKL